MQFPNYSGTRVLVTGGAGFIGSHIVRSLVDSGANVRVLDNFVNGRPENLSGVEDKISLLKGDLLNPTDCAQAAHDRDIVFHLAALGSVPASMNDPLRYNQNNITGTLTLLEACRSAGVRRVVYSGSSSAYGDTPTLPKVETMSPSPLSPYAVSKLTCEYYMSVYGHAYGLQTVTLRYFNVFGPRQNPNSQYAAVIPAFIAALLKGVSPTIYGDGEQSRDFCFVDNVVYANLLAGMVDKPLSGQVVNIACHQATTLNELFTLINKHLNLSIKATYVPARVGDVKHSLADISAAQKLLGYEPKVYFEEGLARTVAWFSGQKPA